MQSENPKAVDYYNKRFGSEKFSEGKSDHDLVRYDVISRVLKLELKRTEGRKLTILDFGCGGGWLSKRLSEFGTVTGLDLADKAIEAAKTRYPGIEFICLNASSTETTAFLQRKFDVIVSSEVIEHVTDKQNYIDNMLSLLSPGGLVILTTPNGQFKDAWFVPERVKSKQPIEDWVDAAWLTDKLSTGLDDLRVSTFYSQWIYYYKNNSILRSDLIRRVSLKLLKITGSFSSRIEKLNEQGVGLYLIATGRKK